jgi:hypothetical protein
MASTLPQQLVRDSVGVVQYLLISNPALASTTNADSDTAKAPAPDATPGTSCASYTTRCNEHTLQPHPQSLQKRLQISSNLRLTCMWVRLTGRVALGP